MKEKIAKVKEFFLTQGGFESQKGHLFLQDPDNNVIHCWNEREQTVKSYVLGNGGFNYDRDSGARPFEAFVAEMKK